MNPPQEQSVQVKAAMKKLAKDIVHMAETHREVYSVESHWNEVYDLLMGAILPFLAPPVTQPAANGEEVTSEVRDTPETDAFYGCPPRSSGKDWQVRGTKKERDFARSLELRIIALKRTFGDCFPAPATATEQEGENKVDRGEGEQRGVPDDTLECAELWKKHYRATYGHPWVSRDKNYQGL